MGSSSDKNIWHYNDSSENPYYRQRTVKSWRHDTFGIASLVMGSLSVLLSCTVILPLPLSSLGLIFASLSYRSGKPFTTFCLTGFMISLLGMLQFVGIVVYLFREIMLPQ
ncbi:MAG: hypothetical protein LBM60_09445 [Clostridium sp.]|nr:hypothetical protein [Clostridium sp.]